MADQSEKSKTKDVSVESRIEKDASRAGSDQAQADMPEHLEKTSKEKSAFDRAGLIPTARSHAYLFNRSSNGATRSICSSSCK